MTCLSKNVNFSNNTKGHKNGLINLNRKKCTVTGLVLIKSIKILVFNTLK